MYERGRMATDIQDCPNLKISLIVHTSVVNIGKFINVTIMMQMETSEDCAYILELEGDLFQQ